MAYKDVVLADKPLAYWRLGERSGTSAVDSGGGGFTGTLTATGITLGMRGPLADPKDSDTAMLFDGTNGVISASASSFLPAGTNVWSLEAWLKPSALDASFRRIMGREPAANHGAFLAINNVGQVYALRGDAAAAFDAITSTVALLAGQWTYLVATYDGSLIRLYQNGVLNGSVASSRSVDESTNLMYLGNASAGGATMGALDEAATYSTVLSPDRVAAHYQAGLANFAPAEHAAACSFHVSTSAGAYVTTLRGVLTDPVFSSKLNEGFAAVHLELDHYPTEIGYGNLVRIDFPDGTVAGKWKFEERNVQFVAPTTYSTDLVPLVEEASSVDFNANYTADTTQPTAALGIAEPATVTNAAIARTVHLSAGTILNVGTSYGYAYNNAVVRDAIDQHVLFAGAGWWWMVHETGVTDVRNTTAYAHSMNLGREISETNFEENIHAAINVQPVVGATPASGTVPLTATAIDNNGANALSVPNLGRRVAKVYTDTSLVDQASVSAMATSLLGMQERVAYRRTYRVTGYTAQRVRCGDSLKTRIPNTDPTSGSYAVVGPLVIQEVVQYGATNTYDLVCTDSVVIFNQRAQESRTNAIDKLIQNSQRVVPVSPDGSTGTISSGALGNAPNTPTGLALATFIETTAQVENAAITATWSASAVDSTHASATIYNLRYRRTGTTPWQSASGVLAGTLTGTIVNLIQGLSYDVQVSATNAGGDSAWSATVTQTTAQATAPSQVAQPTVLTAVTSVVVSFNLLAASDIQTYEIWQFTGASTASTPPGGSILAHTGNDAIVNIGGLITAQTYTFWVRAENWSGLFGSYSPYVQATPNYVSSPDVNAGVVSGSLRAYIYSEPSAGSGIANPNSPNVPVAQITQGAIDQSTPSLPVVGTTNYSERIVGYIKPLYSETYTFTVTTDDGARLWINNQQVMNSWIGQGPTAYSGQIALTAGIWYPIVLEHFQGAGGERLLLQWQSTSQALQTVPATQFGYGAGVAGDQVNSMAVDTLAAGILTAGVIMAGNIRSAATVDSTHAGWKSDATSIRFYDGSGHNYQQDAGFQGGSGAGVTVEITSAGAAFFSGVVSAAKVYASQVASNPNMGTRAGGVGYRLGVIGAAPYLDFFTVGSSSAGNRFYYAPDGNTDFSTAGVLSAGTMTFAKGAADSDTETMTTSGGPIIADSLAIASFKPNTTIALRGAVGTFTATAGGSITPPFGQATASGNLLLAWVAANTTSATSITTASSGWVKATAAAAGASSNFQEADIWYKANCGASETAPTFTATLVTPSAADSLVETITTSASVNVANVNNMVMTSFKPNTQSTPIALVSAGAFTTGNSNQASPSFGQVTTGGNLLTAWVSGHIGTTGGGTANLGATAAVSTGNQVTPYDTATGSSDNMIFMGPYTMPQHGTITQLTVNMGGDSAAGTCQLVLWDAAGNVAGTSAGFTPTASTHTAQTRSLQSSVDAANGSNWFIGFWRPASGSVQWGVSGSGGTFHRKNGGGSPSSIAGYANCGGAYFCGDMQAYAQYTIVAPGTDITTTASGWTKAVQALNNGSTTFEETQLWYRSNCGSSEAAPVFTSSYGTEVMYAQLAEWSGVVTASPLDKTGSVLQGAASTSMTVTNSAADAQAGDLVLTASRWVLASAATASFAESSVVNFSATQAGSSGSQSVVQHANFEYGIVPVPTMHAQLAEFSGALTASPLDKTGNANQTSSATALSVTAGSADAANNDLIVTAGRWQQTANSTASWTDSYNNASVMAAGSSGASSLSQHSNFVYGIISGSTTGTVLQLTTFVGLEAINEAQTSLGRGFISTAYSTDTFGSSFIGRKARGTKASPTTVANGDEITSGWAQAYDGSNWYNVGRTRYLINGTVSAGNIPTDFEVQLNPGTGDFTALKLGSDKSATLAGALTIPTSAGGSSIASSYGSVPVKLGEFICTGTTASISFSSIPQTFQGLRWNYLARASNAVSGLVDLGAQWNGTTTGNYDGTAYNNAATTYAYSEVLNTLTYTRVGYVTQGSSTANWFGTGFFEMFGYASTNYVRSYYGVCNAAFGGGGNQTGARVVAGQVNATTALTSVTFIASGGLSFAINSAIWMWGVP